MNLGIGVLVYTLLCNQSSVGIGILHPMPVGERVLTFCCAAESIAQDTGKQVLFANESSFLDPGFVRDPLLSKQYEPNIFIKKSVSGQFHKVLLDEDVEFFYSGDTHIPYILKAEDTVKIKTDELHGMPYILVSDNEIRNNEINFFQQAYINRIPLLIWEQGNQNAGLINVSNVSNNLKEIIILYNRSKEFADNYFKSKIASEPFKEFVYNYIRFDHYIKIFEYIHDLSTIDSLKKIGYFQFDTDANNIFQYSNYAYQGAVYQYLISSTKKKYLLADKRYTFALADRIFKPRESSLFKFLYLKNRFNKMYLSDASDLSVSIKMINNNVYQHVLMGKIFNRESGKAYQNKMIDAKNEITSIEKIIRENKDRLVYIDFWASWCAPCRSEFSNYQILRQKYSPDKITFVFVSIDNDRDLWQKAVKEEGIEAGHSYLLTNPSKEELKLMNLTTIPRYYLYDKTGKMVSNDAYRPGDPLLYEILNKLIDR